MTALTRWLAPATLAVAMGFGVAAPVQAQSQDELVRVLVNVADVVFRGSTPYYRQGDYGYDDRLTVQRDRYGRPVYYRSVPRGQYYGNNNYGNNYGNNGSYNNNGYGYSNNDSNRKVKCNKHGKCKVEYYDPRYSQHPHNERNNHNNQARYDQGGRYWDGRQWRYRDHYSNRDRDHEEHDRRDHDDDD